MTASAAAAKVALDAAGLGAEMEDRLQSVSRLAAAGAQRIVVTWPSPDAETLHALGEAGAAQVIAKPISAARLTAALREGLDAKA